MESMESIEISDFVEWCFVSFSYASVEAELFVVNELPHFSEEEDFSDSPEVDEMLKVLSFFSKNLSLLSALFLNLISSYVCFPVQLTAHHPS